MNRTLLKAFTASALAIAAVCSAPIAMAEETAALHYEDLDLSTEAGKAELAKRIDQVARKVCSSPPMTGTRIRNSADQECMANVRRQIETRLATRTNRPSLGR